MTRALRTTLQLLIVLLWAFLLWRYREHSWGRLFPLSVLFLGLFVLAGALGRNAFVQAYGRQIFYGVHATLLLVLAILASQRLDWIWVLPLVLCIWWGLLMAYLASPALDDFPLERAYFHELGQAPQALLMRGIFILAFWPIFVSKAVYFWGLLLISGLWLLRDYWPGRS